MKMKTENMITPQEILKKYFGYSEFRPGQEVMVNTILSGKDALGIMPTGAGKSICYQVPALLLPGITIVISPLISLMQDQVKSLNEAGIHAAYINSSLTENQISRALQLAAQGRYKIIYVAPERLESREFIWFSEQVQISMVTVDEAHCISQWGQDFRPSYLKIVQFIKELSIRPIVSAFTATATEEVKNDILCVLGLQEPKVLVTGFDRQNLYFGVETSGKKTDQLLRYLEEHPSDSGIIYCATRKNVDMLYEKLQSNGVSVTRYHAGLSDSERKENQDDFIYDRKSVIVATNAFGMGIDKSNVRYVIHYNMPQSMENYYQEAGRAGRDGEPAECILLYSAQDVMINRYLLESKEFDSEMSREDIEAIRERDSMRLRTMTNYSVTSDCLRSYILRYFGETGSKPCGNCSTCLMEYEELERTEEAKQVVLCIMEAKERYGVNVIAGTLAESKRGKLQEYGCMGYNTYGALKQLDEKEIKQIISWLVVKEYLRQTEDKYGLLRLTKRAQLLLDGEEKVVLRIPKNRPQSEEQRRKSKRGISSVDLNPRGYELFEILRTLRMEIARKENVPPYIVFNDKTLVSMCTLVPLTKEDMLAVSGVGENKYAKYGQQFINAISEFTNDTKEKLYFGDMEMAGVEPGEQTGTMTGGKRNRGEKRAFAIRSEQAEQFPYAEKYRAPEIAEKLNTLVDLEQFKKISGAEIFRWIEAEGFASEQYVNGRRTKVVSEAGKEKGLFLETRMSQKGHEYFDLFYDEQAQKMIIEHLIAVTSDASL